MKPKTNDQGLMTNRLPKHVALIMDGNRRWAKAKGKISLEGHKEGEHRIEPIVDRAIELGIPYLTFWAFSTENWNRKKEEVNFLLNLYRNNLNKKVDSFHRKNVTVNVLGNLELFPDDIQRMTRDWMKKTHNNQKITVNIALSYGGRDEIVRAIHKINRSTDQQIKNITVKNFGQFLDTAGQPDPDLMVRTGGQHRLSGFLLWQMEYAEFYFTDVYWPDFTVEEFDKSILWYKEQKRNFGK